MIVAKLAANSSCEPQPQAFRLRRSPRLLAIVLGALLATVATDQAAHGAAPVLRNVSLRGLQLGSKTTLEIEGSDLLPEARLILPFATAQQVVRPDSTADRLRLDVTLDERVPPGIYPLRVTTAGGVSNPVMFGVDRLSQRPISAEAQELPVALSGVLEGASIVRTALTGKSGQPIVVEVEARRLGSSLNPVVRLYDPRGVQVAWGQISSAIGGDARLSAVLPSDGLYTVELHDALYKGAAPGFYRLKIGEFRYADTVFPLAVRAGTVSLVEFVGSNFSAETRVLADGSKALFDLNPPWPAVDSISGSRPQVVVSDLYELLESRADGGLQPITAPVGVNGRLLKTGEEDLYQLAVRPGQTWRIDVFAERVGSPLDGVLSVRNSAGNELAASDDREGMADPGLDFKVPDGVDSLVIALKDLLARGGPAYVYRIEITQAGLPDFSLVVFSDRVQVPRSAATVLRVRANRAGFDGPIALSIPDLPKGMKLTGDEIPAGATDTLLTLSGGDPTAQAAVTSIMGEASVRGVRLQRPARLADIPATSVQRLLPREVAVALANPLPLAVAWETAATDTKLPLGAALPTKVRVDRAAGTTGAVRLSLLTSQIAPTKRVKDEKTNQEKTVEDVDRTLRLEGTPQIAGDQTEAAPRIHVPADLRDLPFDLAIQAELLSEDGKTVLASAVTPAHRLSTMPPFSLELSGDPKVQALAGAGDTGRLKGKVQRHGEFTPPIVVTLVGLPAEWAAPKLELAAGQTDFEFPVAFPFGAKPGPLPSARLVAVSQTPSSVAVRSNEIPVVVDVVAGGPPPPLYRLFEDESSFVDLLTEGGGKAELEKGDRYAGDGALKVTPDQRFRASLPGLGVKIRENPGDGEYRFFRFAWKKHGGNNILLQLNAGGNWGPARGTNGPSYRYEAGPEGNPFNAAAIKLDDKLPDDWVVVTRDLFADFGELTLSGLAFTPGNGDYGLFDQVYLSRSMDDLRALPEPLPAEQPLAVFEDQPEFAAQLNEGAGAASLVTDQKYSGQASLKVTPDQRFNPALPGLGVKIRRNPGPGEFRFLCFAWKKQGGERICLQLNHDGAWGPTASQAGKFRYDAGPGGGETFGAALRVDGNLPADWVVVTRDLYADFGEFTLTGMAFSPVDGELGLFDHIYLGRTPRDFGLVKP